MANVMHGYVLSKMNLTFLAEQYHNSYVITMSAKSAVYIGVKNWILKLPNKLGVNKKRNRYNYFYTNF